ncbi:hypothetical protein KCU83_g116, partial [Aureobasidium melanogenum]
MSVDSSTRSVSDLQRNTGSQRAVLIPFNVIRCSPDASPGWIMPAATSGLVMRPGYVVNETLRLESAPLHTFHLSGSRQDDDEFGKNTAKLRVLEL